MSNIELTDRQTEVYSFIIAFIEEHGYSPSFREIAKGCYFGSISTVAGYIDRLVKKGVLDYTPRTPRTLSPKK